MTFKGVHFVGGAKNRMPAVKTAVAIEVYVSAIFQSQSLKWEVKGENKPALAVSPARYALSSIALHHLTEIF